jgi:NAD-dependent dihydropyrimidine dehydrogenase PreA subunit
MCSDMAIPTTTFSAVGMPVVIDSELCTGCNECVDVCRAHMILPSAESSQPPQVWYPEECWYCGCCVSFCPAGAVSLKHPISRRVGWRRRGSERFYRVGMENPPPACTKPPICPEVRMK